MSELKTRPTDASVEDFLDHAASGERREDCRTIVALMQAATGEAPCMWGSAIVGFGTYHYRYASGQEADWPIIGFSPRKNDLTLYLMPAFDGRDALLAQLGKHKTGKSCLYLKRLGDIDMSVLKKLITASVAAMEPQRVYSNRQPCKAE